MKNIVPTIMLSLGSILSSTTYGQDYVALEKEKAQEESKKAPIISIDARERIELLLTPGIDENALSVQEEWRKNTETLVKSLLPGNPINFRQNGINGIVYPIHESLIYKIQSYIGIYTSSSDSERRIGMVINIPFGK